MLELFVPSHGGSYKIFQMREMYMLRKDFSIFVTTAHAPSDYFRRLSFSKICNNRIHFGVNLHTKSTKVRTLPAVR